jgi:hypothetical protein
MKRGQPRCGIGLVDVRTNLDQRPQLLLVCPFRSDQERRLELILTGSLETFFLVRRALTFQADQQPPWARGLAVVSQRSGVGRGYA